MPTWLKWTIGVGGGLFALKLFNDSSKLAKMIEDKNHTAPPSNFVAGQPLPNPVDGRTEKGTVITGDSALTEANPSTSYDKRGYIQLED